MFNKKWMIGIFIFFLALFSFLFFWETNPEDSQSSEKEIVWIEKPSFMLLKELKSENPVLRREAIVKLGEKRTKEAVEPLFAIMFSDAPLYEKQLAAKSVAMISEETILPLCLRILENYDEKNSKEVVLSILYILKNLDLTGKNLSRYDFSILETLLNASHNEVILNTIESIENLRYIKVFNELTKIYHKNFFFKIAVLKALTQLALEEEKLSSWLSRYLFKILANETNDSVCQAIQESLFALEFKRKPNSQESQLIGILSGLSSSSFKKALEAEKDLLAFSYKEKNLELFSFFLNEKNFLMANRMLDFVKKNKISSLSPNLKNLIKHRWTGSTPKEKEIALDSARKSLETLSFITEDNQDVPFILSFVNDHSLGYEALKACSVLINRHIEEEQILKRLANLYYFTLLGNQKKWLYPFLEVNLQSKNYPKIYKLIQQGDYYIRYNTLIALLNKEKTLPAQLQNLTQSRDGVIKSILHYYQVLQL